jgi:DHA1 family bicyclomycin/chloramphenicol resistance-like MFS transporter
MGVATLANVVLNGVLQPDVRWALIPVSVVSFGWSLTAPALTLIALDLVPERRGMASSVQSFTLGVGNALVAGVLAPLVMHAAWSLALGSAVMVVLGALCWLAVRGRVA